MMVNIFFSWLEKQTYLMFYLSCILSLLLFCSLFEKLLEVWICALCWRNWTEPIFKVFSGVSLRRHLWPLMFFLYFTIFRWCSGGKGWKKPHQTFLTLSQSILTHRLMCRLFLVFMFVLSYLTCLLDVRGHQHDLAAPLSWEDKCLYKCPGAYCDTFRWIQRHLIIIIKR